MQYILVIYCLALSILCMGANYFTTEKILLSIFFVQVDTHKNTKYDRIRNSKKRK